MGDVAYVLHRWRSARHCRKACLRPASGRMGCIDVDMVMGWMKVMSWFNGVGLGEPPRPIAWHSSSTVNRSPIILSLMTTSSDNRSSSQKQFRCQLAVVQHLSGSNGKQDSVHNGLEHFLNDDTSPTTRHSEMHTPGDTEPGLADTDIGQIISI